MSAVADRGYIQAQLQAAEKARERLTKPATRVFGEQRGREVLKRVADRTSRRLRQDNPEIFSDDPN
jgi:hypothetical protein